MSKLFSILTLIFICYVAFGILLFLLQRSFIYYPSPPIDHPFDNIAVINDSVTINTIHVNRGKRKAILYFGGNAEVVALTAIDFAQQLNGFTQVFVDYRGYGRSGGAPSEQALLSDALKVYDSLAPSYREVVVIGRSLGSGVATFLAASRPVNKLVLVTPFDSILRVAQRHYPIYPVSLLLKDKFDSLAYASDIKVETLILAAEKDGIIHPSHTENLANALGDKYTTFSVIKGAHHNDISLDDRYYRLIDEFLTRDGARIDSANYSK